MKRGLAGGVVLLVATGALIGQWQRAERKLESTRLVWNVKERSRAVASSAVPGRVAVAAIPMVQRAIELDPTSVEALAAAGDLYFLLGRDETAHEVYLEALELEPRPELYLNLGILELRKGETEVGEEHLRMARRLNRRLAKTVRSTLERYRSGDAP